VDGVRTYEIVLLPGAPVARAVGWYDYQGALVAGGQLPDQTRLSYYVARTGPEWQIWTIRAARDSDGRWSEQVAVAHASPDRESALGWAEEDIKATGCKIAKLRADWKGKKATEAQVNALRRWRIRRDLSDISRGEASALLDAVIARAKVKNQLKREVA